MIPATQIPFKPPRPAIWLAAAVAVLAAAAAGLLLAGVLSGDSGEQIVITIPAGSAQRAVDPGTGDDADWIEAYVGDVLVIDNRDSVVHEVAGLSALPGQTVRLPLTRPGTIVTECAVHGNRPAVVEVHRR